MGNRMKSLKFIFLFAALVFLCSAALFSCKTESNINIDLKDLADVIADKAGVDLSEDVIFFSPEQIATYYGIITDDTVQLVVIKKLDISNPTNAEVLILVEAKDKDKAKEIENSLKVSKTNKLNELMNYTINPDNERQYYIVEAADIIVNQQYVFWAVFPETKEIGDIISDYIKNNNTP